MKKAMIDIDGVLNYYPQTQLDFYNDKYCKNKKEYVTSLNELKAKVSYAKYKEIKSEYRISSYKHFAIARKGAKQLLDYLEKNDYLIYIITGRELFKDDQLERTLLWLKRNKLKYHYIYCSQKKDFTIFEKFGHIDVVVEDNCDNINKISEINGVAKYYIVNNSDNKNMYLSTGKRVNDLNEILEEI